MKEIKALHHQSTCPVGQTTTLCCLAIACLFTTQFRFKTGHLVVPALSCVCFQTHARRLCAAYLSEWRKLDHIKCSHPFVCQVSSSRARPETDNEWFRSRTEAPPIQYCTFVTNNNRFRCCSGLRCVRNFVFATFPKWLLDVCHVSPQYCQISLFEND